MFNGSGNEDVFISKIGGGGEISFNKDEPKEKKA